MSKTVIAQQRKKIASHYENTYNRKVFFGKLIVVNFQNYSHLKTLTIVNFQK